MKQTPGRCSDIQNGAGSWDILSRYNFEIFALLTSTLTEGRPESSGLFLSIQRVD